MKGRKQRYYYSLYEVAAAANSARTPERVLSSIMETVAKALEAKGCSLMLLTPDRKVLLHTAAYGLSDWYVGKGQVSADKSISEALEGKTVAVWDATKDERVQYREQAKREGIASILSVPMMLREEIVGVIRVYTAERRHFATDDIYFVQTVANLGAIALENRRELEQVSSEVVKLQEERRHFVRFLGVVAHDLQSPLVATQSILSYILDGYTGEITNGQRDLMQRGVRRIDGLLTLISDILDIPRIETGQITREMREISFNEVIKRSVEGLDSLARQKGLTLRVELPQTSPKIYGSSRRLQQVVTNLVGNAISYTNEGVVLIRGTDWDSEVRVEVIDSGIGIPAEDLPRLFGDFFRGSNVEIKGTGLGLSISKRIIEAHGGKIWAESPCPETNTGSRFTFTLPKKQTAVQQEKLEQPR